MVNYVHSLHVVTFYVYYTTILQTVKYWGPVPELGEGDWVGVDLENPVGDSDGSISGHVYFETKANHGIFVSPSAVTVSLFLLPPRCFCDTWYQYV